MDFKHFSISDVGQVRQANEDSCGDRMTANGYVFVVCDGMGGHVGGAAASSIAVDSILNFFENPVQNIYVGINDAFQLANTNILNAARQDPSLKGMGTTGTILIINEEACFIGHVGDSRIYLKSDGRLNRLTKDHSFVQTLVDQGIISDDDAEEHPKKNQILEALGIKAQVNPTICDVPIQPKAGDCFLLCSDGLNGMIKDSVIEELIDSDSPERSGRELIDAANRAGGKDNITATLVTITESPFATSVFTHFNPVKTAVASETVIEPMIGQEPKKSKKKLIILLSSIGFLVIIAVLWFAVFNGNQGKPTDPSPSDKDPVTQEDEKDTNEDESNSDEKNNNKEVEQKQLSKDKADVKDKKDDVEDKTEVNEDIDDKEETSNQEKQEEKTEEKVESPKSYVVKRGDNLQKISKEFGVSKEAIIAANTGDGSSLSSEDKELLKKEELKAEWKLIIPAAKKE